MPFNGGGGGSLPPHEHTNIANDGGPLDFNNTTIGSMNSGDMTYSDGAALQQLAIAAPDEQLRVSAGNIPEWFTASGSVYKSDKTTAYPNGTVKLYSAANQGGTLVKSIQVDGLGNFYTTESISFSSGLYPAVEYSGQTNTMQSTTTSGRCYTCHVSGGVAGNVIYGP